MYTHQITKAINAVLWVIGSSVLIETLYWGSCHIAAGALKRHAACFERSFWRITAFLYILVIVYYTVWKRTPGNEFQICLRPLWSYDYYFGLNNVDRNQGREVLSSVILNVLLYVPAGFAGTFAFRRTAWKYVLPACACLSALLELVQLAFRLGLCETDDVIHNTLGAVLGIIVAKAEIVLFKKINRIGK